MNPRRRLMWRKKARAATNVDVVNTVEPAAESTLQEIATQAVAESTTKAPQKVVTKKRSTRKTTTKTVTTKKK